MQDILLSISPYLPFVFFPIAGALIGWITNFLAVRMLFRPRYPKKFFFITIQGLVPKRQRELALSIGETVEKNLLNHEDIGKVLTSEKVVGTIKDELKEYATNFLDALKAKNPMVGMFLQGDLANQVTEVMTTQLEEAVPHILRKTSSSLENNLDFKTIIKERIEQFDLSTLEELVQKIASKELKTIEYLGGVLGFLVGVLQAATIPLFH